MNLYKCLYCEKVYRTFQARNAHQGKCESGRKAAIFDGGPEMTAEGQVME